MTKKEKDKLAKAKALAKKKAVEKAAKKRVRGEAGPYGFGINTIKHKFCSAISRKAKTMKELIGESWNSKGRTHYGFFNELKAAGTAGRTDDKKMFIVGSKADPKKKARKKK